MFFSNVLFLLIFYFFLITSRFSVLVKISSLSSTGSFLDFFLQDSYCISFKVKSLIQLGFISIWCKIVYSFLSNGCSIVPASYIKSFPAELRYLYILYSLLGMCLFLCHYHINFITLAL